jgi:glyoxylase-like metal-dependent hydrolase (beta-lactamase superfamily II)
MTIPNLSRRAFTFSLARAPAVAAAASLATTLGHGASAKAAGSTVLANPLAQIKIGRFEVTFLTDGYTDMPFNYFTGRTPEEVEKAAAGIFTARKSGIRIAFNQYLINDGERLILVDSGPAGAIGRTGMLPGALEAIGVEPRAVDAVILTHMHFDHISGLIAGGRANFPNAEVYADRRDVTYFTDPAKRAAAPGFLKSSFDASAEVVRLYPKLQQTDGERQITRGISIVDLTGHTPGHVGVRIEDGGDSLLLVSDTLFHPSVHPQAADVGFVFEQDPAAALTMRQRFFPRAAEERALIAATHMPFPGLGRIVRENGRLRWLNAEWAHQG